jgi:AraC family transcriptional regulator
MSKRLLSAAQFAELMPTTTSVAWGVFAMHVVQPPIRASVTLSDHLLGLQLSGVSHLRQEAGGRSTEAWAAPGSTTVIPAELSVTHEDLARSGTVRSLTLFVPHAFLSRVIAEDWDADPSKVEIISRFLIRDPVLESVLFSLARETQQGSPSGQLYAESACQFLAHHMIHSHSSLSAPAPHFSGGLPTRSLKNVLDYIDQNLEQPISLHTLAGLAGVSARHLERAFRQSVGVPPHMYVLEKRVALARRLLDGEPDMTVKQIAKRSGFSSSSHLASVFRRQTGTSPSVFRRLHSRKT